MSRQRIVEDGRRRAGGDEARRRVLAGAPVTERRVDLAGVSTAVLESGDGPPVVLLHGQGGWSGMWLPVMGDLMGTHRVIAADLPGLGASELPDGPPGAARVLAWLGALIERTCPAPPVLVGASLGGLHRRPVRHRPPGPGGRAGAGGRGQPRPVPARAGRPARPGRGSGPAERAHPAGLPPAGGGGPGQGPGDDGRALGGVPGLQPGPARTPSVRAANRRMLRELGTKGSRPRSWRGSRSRPRSSGVATTG